MTTDITMVSPRYNFRAENDLAGPVLSGDALPLQKTMAAYCSGVPVTANEVPLTIDDDDAIDEDCNSLDSMETLSDNISIWIDGEKHWVSGVDSTTTCADLINALLNFQDLDQQNDTCKVEVEANKHSMPECSNSNLWQSKTKDSHIADSQSMGMTVKKRGISATEYVIVKQLQHCEEYLDAATKVFDVLPVRDVLARKECELFLRHTGKITVPVPVPTRKILTNITEEETSASNNKNKQTAWLSMDKDSGMGSPVGSSRSARLRRRVKYKSATVATTPLATHSGPWWDSQNVHMDPLTRQKQQMDVVGENTPNERLMKIILAQDETIYRQLTLLREKERQILKIEEEKHRVRESELGKNYLLETYLNALDDTDQCNYNDEANDGIMEAVKENPSIKPMIRSSSKELTPKEIDEKESTENPENQQLYWLEKMYAMNKQLLRKEELVLRLHAKVRKNQIKRAYRTKSEVLRQIEILDTDLSAQVENIHGVERKLLAANEQLKAKLGVLELLSSEFEAKQQQQQQQQQQKLIGVDNVEDGNYEELREPLKWIKSHELTEPYIVSTTCQNNDNDAKQRDMNNYTRQFAISKTANKQMFQLSPEDELIQGSVKTLPQRLPPENIVGIMRKQYQDITTLGTLV